MTGPLQSLTVVEFTGLGPAPLAGQLLADLGARVTVIDRTSGTTDPTDINRRGKDSIALNLKTEEGRAIALRLIEKADILIEGFRPGVMERLGLGPEDCPDHLIYGRMTGWGQSGPWAQRAGHDINYLAMTGALQAMGDPAQPPRPPLNLVADFGGGSMFLIFGVLAAVIERAVSGKGQVVDAAMVDGVSAMMGLIHMFLAQGRWQAGRGSNWLDGASHFYRCYECADGKFLSVGALEPQFYDALLERTKPDLREVAAQMDDAAWPAQADALASLFRTRTRDDWVAEFDGTDACVAPVLDFGEARTHPVNRARGVFGESDGVWQARPAPRFSRSDPSDPSDPKAAGADTDTVLTQLGFDASGIAGLRNRGILT
ncbi:MAG: CaiB/BaiF CoA-transferase family protein [Pseudomonadota bacterium]